MAIPLLLLLVLVAAPRSVQASRQLHLHLHPIVLVPGYASNELDARLTQLYRPSSLRCGERKGQGWFRLFLNQSALRDPAGVRCFGEQMSTVYDAASDDYYNVPGVETRVPFFGSTKAFRYPDPDDKNFSYMEKLVERLEKMGYRDGETMFGAPYDFRYAVAPVGRPSRVGSAFFRALKSLVERASQLNGGRPVIIFTHSYGGTLAQQFLVRRPLPWRRRFVRRFVPVAAPWGGLVLGMQVLLSGNNLALPFVDPLALRQEYRSLQSSLWPLPSPAVFGTAQPLVTTKSRNYSAGDVADFLGAIGLGEAVEPYESRVLPLFGELPAPLRVPVSCVVGVGVGTPERMVYPGDDFDVTPGVVVGDGDGLVNLASLVAVETAWRRAGHFRMVKVPNVSHTGILLEDRALDIVILEIKLANLISPKI
ncbi:lecithin-cholesterol acyltransferase-like 1 [Lolium perenne]|uniref:lecithin-cholesterol acyltransferase-like 1 n=1 Tax=Lolium perenne TaxID=4522 RepID=UPI0021F5E3B2|nr:lecithin-cholesterol acyltransferase-like 1 [Lolium perenne]